jgi:predicted neuraminidase
MASLLRSLILAAFVFVVSAVRLPVLAADDVNNAVPASAPAAHASLPTIDLSGDAFRQVVVAQGTPDVYQGHPTTLLMPDGKTLLCVWTYGHGGACGPMKRSDDGGKTWSDLLPVPENWRKARNCPALYRLADPNGIARLFVFAGQGPDGSMQQSHSDDEGKTWTPMAGNGLRCIMPFCTVVPIDGGKALLAQTNIRRPGETKDKTSNIIAQSLSTDGGLTWSAWRIVLDLGEIKPCEPEIVRSPDKKQLLCLMRENSRKLGGLFMTSNDEGRTWSKALALPPGLHGNRFKAHYAPDGRLIVCFRDVGRSSPTKDHFVAWVGRYEDIIAGRDGQYKIKLLHSYAGSDCGYPGLELLPDGTFVATTYIKYRPGPAKQSVVSTRFRLEETDKLAGTQEQPADDALLAPAINTAPGPEYADDTRSFQGIPGIERAANGRLWAIWYAGGPDQPGEGPGNYVAVVTSNDDGKTWSGPKLVIDPKGPLRAYDPCLWHDPAGRLWLFWAQSYQWWDGRSGVWSIVAENSADENPHWSAPRRLCDGIMLNKPTVLSTENWLLPAAVWAGKPKADSAHAHDLGTLRGANAIASSDKGQTFTVLGQAVVPKRTFDEHSIIERGDGSLWMLVRTAYGIGQSVSTDGGKTWSVGRPTNIPHVNSRFFIRRLRSGKLLLVTHEPPDHKTRSHLTAHLSSDDGRTWQGGLTIDERKGVSYPDGVEAPDGTIYLIYDYHRTTDREILLARFTEQDIMSGHFDSPGSQPRILVNKATGVRHQSASRAASAPTK